jgi:hypothetical protein
VVLETYPRLATLMQRSFPSATVVGRDVRDPDTAWLEALPPVPMPWGTTEELAALVLKGVRSQKAEIVYPAFYKSTRLFREVSQAMTSKLAPKPKRSAP